MCGIIGIINGNKNIISELVDGLQRLEYRGYDSAGLAVIDGAKHLKRLRVSGKVSQLNEVQKSTKLSGKIGIAHTRWATHGKPVESNAHPHTGDSVAIVHNGIIENYAELKHDLLQRGYIFSSETDSEVIVHLLEDAIKNGKKPHDAMTETVTKLRGAFAIVALFLTDPSNLYGAVMGSPLVVGIGDNEECYVASDALAFAKHTNKVVYLQDGETFKLSNNHLQLFDEQANVINRPVTILSPSIVAIDRGNYRHFMAKEIDEQPTVISNTLRSFWNIDNNTICVPNLPIKPQEIDIIACGTSYFAGMVAKVWLETNAKIPTNVHIASEFRYRPYFKKDNKLHILISQSGETADIIASMKYIHSFGGHTMAVVNVENSTLARLANETLLTKAGPEIGVASTKAFTTQLMTIAILSLAWSDQQNLQNDNLLHDLLATPGLIRHVLDQTAVYQKLAHGIMKNAVSTLFVGRGISYAVALEGALKLKELSYIHAEALAAGELKHGSIALVDEHLPVIVIAPSDDLFEKTASNVEEIAARGGKLIIITDKAGAARLQHFAVQVIILPETTVINMPMIYTIPLQMLAYHVALARGTDIDQPRNLAKSVTVE